MARQNRSTVRGPRLKSQLNITPLIDILLVLIVIFMVVTPITPEGQKAEITKQSVTQPPQKHPEDALVLSVGQDRVITLNRMRLQSTAELSMALRDIFKTRSDRTIFLQGSKDLVFDGIAQVIDAVRGGGADRIGLMTDEIH